MPRSIPALGILSLCTVLATGTMGAADGAPGGSFATTVGSGTVTFLPLPMTAADRSVRDLAFGASELALDEAGAAGSWVGAYYSGGRFADTDPRPDTVEQGAGLALGYGFASGFGGYLAFGQARTAIEDDNGDVSTQTALIGLTYANTLPGGWDYAAALYAGQSQTDMSGGALGDGDHAGTAIGFTIRGSGDIWRLSQDRVLDLVVQGDIAEVSAEGYDLSEIDTEIDARTSTAMAFRFEIGLPHDHAIGTIRPFVGFTKWGGQQGDVEASAFGGSTSFRAADLYGTHQGTLGISVDLPRTGLKGTARYSFDSNEDSLLNLSLGLSF